VQRRRKPKNLPKNIFGKDSNKESKKKIRVATPIKPTPKASPSPTTSGVKNIETPSPPQIQTEARIQTSVTKEKHPDKKPEATKVAKEIITAAEPPIIKDKDKSISARKSVGLKTKKGSKKLGKKTDKVQSNKAIQLIKQSKLRASQNTNLVNTKNNTATKPVAKPPPKPRRRARKTSYQPANRARRLDRSRHMEYRYEMRGLLKNIDIAEEHRSGLLGSIWAKGERQTAAEAKLYLDEKINSGIIDEYQLEKLTKIIDEYTIRR
jgi:hypothetical protein